MHILLTALLLSCRSEPTEVVSVAQRPAVVVVAPLAGQNAVLGQAAVQGVMLAMDDQYRVEAIDEGGGDPIAAAKAVSPLVGVIAHISPTPAARYAQRWAESGLPVLFATNQVGSEVPAILPDAAAHARCASAFVPRKTSLFLANDGTETGSSGAEELKRTVDVRYVVESRAVDPRQIGREAQRVKGTRAKTLVYTGESPTGGNLLRTLRSVDSKVEFVGIGLYDQSFVTAAGDAAHGAIVTSADRPGLDAQIPAAFERRFGSPPLAAALNAYDAARLLRMAFESAEVEGDQNLVSGTRQRIRSVTATGVAGPIRMGPDGSPDPDWCTGFAVKQGVFHYRGVARADDARTRIEIVHEPGMAMPIVEPIADPTAVTEGNEAAKVSTPP